MKTIRQLLTPLVVLSAITWPRAQPLLLNSYPPAKATVYLDFTGAQVEGTAWNWNGPIKALPSGLSGQNIAEIFARISDDYRPFNLNITTDPSVYKKAPRTQKIRIIFTPSSSWYGYAGGVSYVGSFCWGDETPAWVFNELLGNNPKYIASFASHEIGHTLGLQHQSVYDNQCNKITECGGGWPGLSGWAPIMGVGLYQACVTWHKGPSSVGCRTIQDDLETIAGKANNFGLRKDDYSDDYAKAEEVKIYGHEFSIRGLINHPSDQDAFRIDLCAASEMQIQAAPSGILENQEMPSQVMVQLLNKSGAVIGRYDPGTLFNNGISRYLEQGTYYLILEYSKKKYSGRAFKPEYYALSGSLVPASDIQQIALLHQLRYLPD